MKISELLNESEGSDKYAELSKKIRDLAQAGKEGEANKLRYELNRLLMLDRDKKRRKERGVAEDWNKVNHHDKTNGLSQKAVNAYRHEHPGSHLQTAVTTKPSKLKKGSKAAKRRKSFCARMSGNKGPMKKPNGKPTPKALALRRWNCESIEEMQELIQLGEQYIDQLKENYVDRATHKPNVVYDQLRHALKAAEKRGMKVVRSAGGYYKLANMDDPSPALQSNSHKSEQEQSIRDEISRLKQIRDLYFQNKEFYKKHYYRKFGSTTNKLDAQIAQLNRNLRDVPQHMEEKFLPSSTFTGSKKNKINGKGMLHKGPAKAGKLVGGG